MVVFDIHYLYTNSRINKKVMRCICCNAKIEAIYQNENKTEEQLVFDVEHRVSRRGCTIVNAANSSCRKDGLVGIVSAGFGSSHDGDEFAIGVCDKCIDEKLNTGQIAYLDNNIGGDSKKGIEIKNKWKDIWKKFNL